MNYCGAITYIESGNHVHCQLSRGHFGDHFCEYPGGNVKWTNSDFLGFPIKCYDWLGRDEWYLISPSTSNFYSSHSVPLKPVQQPAPCNNNYHNTPVA